jgi:hypothetical protein
VAKRSMRVYGLIGGGIAATGVGLLVVSVVTIVRAIILP